MGVVLYAPFQENDYTRAKSEAQETGPIPKSQFTWDVDRQVYRCPEGHELGYLSSRTESRAGGQEVVLDLYRCPGKYCQACPRRVACTSKPVAGRTVSRASRSSSPIRSSCTGLRATASRVSSPTTPGSA